MKKYIIGGVGIVISGVLVYYISRQVSFEDTWQNLNHITIWQLLLLMIVYLSSFIPRALRWKLMINNITEVPLKETFLALIAGFAGNNFIPARGGELLRMEIFSRRTKMARITSLTSVIAEKILDGLVLLLFLSLSIIFIDSNLLDTIWLKNLLIMAGLVFIIAISVILIIKFYKDQILKILELHKSKQGIELITGIVKKVLEALQFLSFDLNTFKVVILSIVIWQIESLVFILGIYFLDFQVPFIPVGVFVLAIVNFGILVPSSPAYVGIFQGMAIISLSLFNISTELALTLGIITHFAQFFPVSFLGLILLLNSVM